MIKDMKIRVTDDPRGQISTGRLSSSGQMEKLDYFNIAPFEELIAAYGRKPKAIIVSPPTDNPLDFSDSWYESWGKGKGAEKGSQKRRCDGETCLHRITESIEGHDYEAGTESPCVCRTVLKDAAKDDKRLCRYHAWWKFYILIPQSGRVENPRCYKFHNHSKNSGDALFSELEKVKKLNEGYGNRLAGIPFVLSVKMVSGKEAKQTFPIWTLRVFGTVDEIQQGKFLTVSEESRGAFLLEQGEKLADLPQEEKSAKELLLERIGAAGTRDELTSCFNEMVDLQKKDRIDLFEAQEIESLLRDKAKKYPAKKGT